MNAKAILIAAPVLALGACSPAGPDPEKTGSGDEEPTYLVSLVDLPIGKDESMESFHFDTWGVTFHKICRFPNSWSIEAGVGVTARGVFGGQGSNGVSWFNDPNDSDLQNIALVSFWAGPMTQQELRAYEGTPDLPAAFAGTAHVTGLNEEFERPISGKNIKIVVADDCPPPPVPPK